MWMDTRLVGWVPEHVVEQAQQTVEALLALAEHMFATLWGVSDRTGEVQAFLHDPETETSFCRAFVDTYSADQTSSFVCTRASTSSVNSVVPA
jgi:hypothetical protein